MNTVGWIAACVGCLSLGGFLGAFAMGISAGATRQALVRQIAQRDKALRAYTHPDDGDGAE